MKHILILLITSYENRDGEVVQTYPESEES